MSALGDTLEGESGVPPEVSSFMADKARKRWATSRAKDAMREAMSGGEPHPLFPTEPGEPIPCVDWINVTRFERRGPVDCPKVFAAAELVTLEDLAQMYGGGSYELRGRCSGSSGQPGPMVRRARYTIDGPSYPFTGEDASAPEAGALQQQAPAAMDPIVMFMTMMKESQAEARAAGERQMQMLVALLTNSAAQQTASMQAMASIMGAAMSSGSKGPDVATLLAAVSGMSSAQMQAFAQMVPKPDTSDPIEKIGKLLEVAKAMKGDEDSLTSLMAGFGQAAAGIAELERAGAAANAAKQQAAQQQQQEPAQEQQQQAQSSAPANGHANGTPAAASGTRPRSVEAEALG